MQKKIGNVLGLFDGMSCGQIALNRVGIKYDNYFASEIKPHAIKVTKYNYPNTIHIGDITKVDFSELPKIDLLIGGSPCQDFSRANKERKGLRGDKSSLFYYYLKALDICKPKYFLLENVIMGSENTQIISNELGVYPVRINSSLVSAQLRDRQYWTNIPGDDIPDFYGRSISQPKDKKITLQSILIDGYADRNKARCLLESDSRRLTTPKKMMHRYFSKGFTTLVFGDLKEKENTCRYLNQTELERCQTAPDGYTKILTRDQAACLLGDGWTVDVICHILKGIKK